jgi:O-succinylbenzoic acid--CoA ligase
MTDWLQLARAKHPERVAIEGPERRLTYAELCDAAIAGARELQERGVRVPQPAAAREQGGGVLRHAAAGEVGGPGAPDAPRRVAIALPPGEDFLVALHACILAGAAAVPVDLRHTEEERARRMAGADIVISEPLGGLSARGDAPGQPFPAVSGDRTIAIVHTSGTTASPKPVALTRRNFEASALGSAVALGLDPAERWLCPMPLTHVGGLSIPIRSAIYATTVVLHGGFDTEAVLNDLMSPERRITMVSLVPTMLARLLDAGLDRPPTLRWALLGGGPIPAALISRAQDAGVPVAPTYGMTETGSQVATFGWPLPGAEVRLEGHEILVRGPMVSAGALAQDGWLHTGDLGRFDERGRLEIVGRRAETIISGGENVAPAEVEAVLLAHPAVDDAAVFARPDPQWGEAVVAALVVRDGLTVTGEDLRAFCASRLASFKVPKSFELRDRLPRTESGKLLRRELGRLV